MASSWPLRSLGLLAGAAWLGCAGCTKVLSVDEYRVGTPPSAPEAGRSTRTASRCGAFAFSESRCAACLETSCCTEGAACVADPTCRAFIGCDGACAHGDGACIGKCGVDVLGQTASVAVADFVSCRASSCFTECGLTPAGAWSRGEACDQCLNDACPADTKARNSDRAASELTACYGNCEGLNTNDRALCGCETGIPTDSVAKQTALSACRSGPCAVQCDQSDWSCLGSVVAPGASGASLELHLFLDDWQVPTKRYPGTRVTPCELDDWQCNAPLPGATDADNRGIADLTLTPTNARGYSQFVVFSGANVNPELFVFWPLLVRSTWRATLLQTPDEAMAIGRALTDGAPGTEPGTIGVVTHSCLQRPGPGVVLELPDQPQSRTTYLGSDPNKTSDTNFAGILNVKPGLVRVVARVADGGPADGKIVADLRVPVQAGPTFMELGPLPVVQ